MFFQWQTTNRDEHRIFTNEMGEGDKKLGEIKSEKNILKIILNRLDELVNYS